MAYNRRNLLEKIIEVQEITISQQIVGLSKKKIYEKFIKKQYHISRDCYFRYLGTNAKRQLKILNEKELNNPKQLTLFDNGK